MGKRFPTNFIPSELATIERLIEVFNDYWMATQDAEVGALLTRMAQGFSHNDRLPTLTAMHELKKRAAVLGIEI